MRINIKNKKKAILIILESIMLIAISIEIAIIKYENGITLIQLSNQTKSQMMGYVMVTKNSKVIIIDGGTVGDSDNLIQYINEYGGKVDYWFLTHHHNDHCGAIVSIIKNTDIEIDNIYISLNDDNWYKENEPERYEFTNDLINTLENSRIKENIRIPYINEKIKIDNIKCEILGIKNPEIVVNPGNNQSMVFKFKVNDTSILFLGDTSVESQNKLIENNKEKLKSDIVQMAHHGQKGADINLYRIISPKTCLFPTPDWLWNNDSGEGEDSGPWKTKETRKWCEELKVKNIYPAKDGDIKLKVW